MIRADECVITDMKSMHELLTRSGLYLPELTSKWCTKQMLLDIRKKHVHTLK
jgi:hypothetical protein